MFCAGYGVDLLGVYLLRFFTEVFMFYLLNEDERFVVSIHTTKDEALERAEERLATIKKLYGLNAYQNLYVAQMRKEYNEGDYYDEADLIRNDY